MSPTRQPLQSSGYFNSENTFATSCPELNGSSEPFQFPRYGRPRRKWEGGTDGSERLDTTACWRWAMKKHSRNYSLLCPVRECDCASLSWARFSEPQRVTRSRVTIFAGHTVLFQANTPTQTLHA